MSMSRKPTKYTLKPVFFIELFCWIRTEVYNLKKQKGKKKKRHIVIQIILLPEDCYASWVLRPHLEVMCEDSENPIILYCAKSTRMKRVVLRSWGWERLLSCSDALLRELRTSLLQVSYVSTQKIIRTVNCSKSA